jgi:hypothetical protein
MSNGRREILRLNQGGYVQRRQGWFRGWHYAGVRWCWRWFHVLAHDHDTAAEKANSASTWAQGKQPVWLARLGRHGGIKRCWYGD